MSGGKVTHGHTIGGTRSPTFRSWCGMRDRCSNPRVTRYEDYGGRGIRVCERWGNFATFLADMGEKPPGTSLDRIDNSGNYEPGNCRWATVEQQQNNTRRNCHLTAFGETLTITQWARRNGIHATTIERRIKKLGWSTEKAIATPPAPRRSLSADQEDAVRREYAAGGTSHKKLAVKPRVSANTIRRTVNRRPPALRALLSDTRNAPQVTL